MTQYRREFNLGGNPINYIVGLVLAFLVLYGLFRLAGFVFNMILYISPLLIIATLLIDYKVITGYLGWVVDLFKKNVWYGVGATAVTFFAFPIVSIFLLSRALMKRQVKKAQEGNPGYQSRRDEYIQYEELESRVIEVPKERPKRKEEPKQEAPKQEIPKREAPKAPKDESSDYDQFFD